MGVDPLDALEAEAARTEEFLASLQASDWDRPTRCPPMDVRDLAAHTLRGALRLQELIPHPVEGEPEKDAITYWQYDVAATGSLVVQRAQAEAASRPGRQVAVEWGPAFRDGIALARAHLDDDPILASPLGTIRLREYIRTRCVELTIHSMDLRDALGMAPEPTPDGLAAACDVLRGILGTDLRRMSVDEVRFALIGTGREQLNDAEREILGPLADRFPLLQ